MLVRLVRERAACPFRLGPALALLLALAGFAVDARAQPAPASPAEAEGGELPTRPLAESLRVVGGRCWDGPSLVAAVREWLKRDEVDARLAIEVRHLVGPPERVVFVVKRGGKRASERVFRDMRRPCADQRAAVSLSIALSIDATLLLRPDVEAPPVEQEPAPPEPEPPPPAPAPPPPETPRPRAARPAPPRPLPVRASLEAGAAFGVLPAPTPFASLSLGVGPFHGVSVRLAALATPEAGAGLGRGRVESQLWGGRVDGCLGTGPARIEGRGCVGLLYGRGTARGVGFTPSREDAFPWVGSALRFEARAALGASVALVGGIDGVILLREVRLRVSDREGAPVAERELSRFGLMAGAGVSLSLW
jgi:hypothetical protein